jgi:protein-S-isoprenylcysteine O-methyltransferase Ste14
MTRVSRHPVLIINALMILPGLFMESPAWVTIVSAVVVVATLVAVILTMRREQTPVRVFD